MRAARLGAALWSQLKARKNRHSLGDTLVEVIVSLALLGLVSMFIMQTLLFGLAVEQKARNKSKNALAAAGAVASSSDPHTTATSSSLTITFRDAHSSAVVVSVPGSYVKGTVSDTGKGDGVTFFTFTPGASSSSH